MTNYPRIEDDKYKKLLFQMTGQYRAILNVFRCYGLDPYVDGAEIECVKVAERFAMAVRGWDKPIQILKELKRRATD